MVCEHVPTSVGSVGQVASRADPHLATVAGAAPTHLLLWNYRPGKKGQRIGWHRDNWQVARATANSRNCYYCQ